MVPDNIFQQREDIIQNNNTAQAKFADILESSNKANRVLRITVPLYGEIDLSILKEQGAANIRDLEFAEGGKITSIRGIPGSLERLCCPNNLLTTLEDLPDSLANLEVQGNYLTEIDVSRTTELQVLNVSHNYIRQLVDLPPSLLEIECTHNKLTQLDLKGLDNLNKLNVSNNMITVIENLPENVVDFHFDNNPSIEFRNSYLGGDTDTDADADADDDEEEERGKKGKQTKKQRQPKHRSLSGKLTVPEALREYFRLKAKYEAGEKKAKERIAAKVVANGELSIHTRAKIVRRELHTFRAPCIKCGRKVGTVFSKKNKRYTAVCGDMMNACTLNIQIYIGDYTPIPYFLYELRDMLEELKEKIICQKLDTLFQYISETTSVEMFKEEVEGFSTYSDLLTTLTEKYNDIYNNEQQAHEIVEKEGVIFKSIEQIRKLLHDYRQEGDPKILEAIVRLQLDELYPEIQNLRLLKHQVVEMEGRVLVKMPVVLTSTEHNMDEDSRVISFVK
jgi:hypothetical protein